MAYSVELSPGAIKQLKKLDGEVQRRIAVLIGKIETLPDPRSIGEALHGDKLGSFWKYRVGDWRIVASIKDAVLTVVVIEIDHRSTIYR